jgi:hypothetical protein
MMEALIRLVLKIIKIILGVVIVFVFFVLANVISMTTLSYLSIENFKHNESPDPIFMLVLESYDGSLDQPIFYCVSWADFEEMDCRDPNGDSSVEKMTCVDSTSRWPRDYYPYISVTNGSCGNMSSDFEVDTVGPNEQIVKIRWYLEALKVENHYSIVDNEIKPLYFRKFTGAGMAVSGFLISLVLTPVFVIIFSRFIKRYKKSKPRTKLN